MSFIYLFYILLLVPGVDTKRWITISFFLVVVVVLFCFVPFCFYSLRPAYVISLSFDVSKVELKSSEVFDVSTRCLNHDWVPTSFRAAIPGLSRWPSRLSISRIFGFLPSHFLLGFAWTASSSVGMTLANAPGLSTAWIIKEIRHLCAVAVPYLWNESNAVTLIKSLQTWFNFQKLWTFLSPF